MKKLKITDVYSFIFAISGRNHLLAKHVCTIESALRYANISRVVVALTSSNLHVTANNVTCQLYKKYTNQGLIFRYVDTNSIFKNTKLETVHETNTLELQTTKNQDGGVGLSKELVAKVHYSDAIRLVLIYKYGGFYSDLDVIFLKSINQFKNIVSCDDVSTQIKEKITGEKLTNAIFHFEAKHPFISSCIENFVHSFDGYWASGGPKLFQQVFYNVCQQNQEVCSDMTLLPSKYFFPVPWYEAVLLFEKKPNEYWDELFRESYAVHLYDSSVNGKRTKKIHKSKFFGKQMPSLTYLSIDHCPIALNSQ